MTQKLRRGQIASLANDIALIGDDFEAFGQIVMDHFLPVRLTHPGLNQLGFPVGYTVDTVDPDGKVVAEYSAERNYFYKDMPKAKRDLAHALTQQPDAETIYLLSSQRLRNAPLKAFRAAAYANSGMKNRKLRVWGAVEIATVIRDEFLFNDDAVEQLAPFLPALRRIRDEEAVTLEMPERDERHLDLPEVDDEVERRLRKSRCVSIAGLPGSGKSATAKSYAARRKKSYDLPIWLEGSKVGSVKALNAVPITRGGENRNVSYLLRTHRCLLVLDDVEANLNTASLAALCGPGSRILITRQKPLEDSYVLPPTDKAVSREMLDRDAAVPCPDHVFDIIWQTVGGHPLTLGLINAVVRNDTSWDDVARDCDAIGEFDVDGMRLADRMLGRIRPLLARELSVFEWAGQSRCDERFLDEVIRPVGVRKLRDNALTAADRPAVVRLHDIIFAALSAEQPDPARNRSLDDALETYIKRVSQQNTLDFWNAAKILRPKLEALARGGDRRPAFLYALLEIWTGAQFDPALLVDPDVAAADLAVASDPADPIAIAAIIETIECQYLHDMEGEGPEVAVKRLSARLPVFDNLAKLSGLNPQQEAQIAHHKGKALIRTRRRDDAIALFEALLTKAHVLPETKLQLIRLHQREASQADRVAGWTREILDEAAAGLVGRSLALAAIENLPWGDDAWRHRLIARREVQIETTIVTAAEAGMTQAYRALASIGRYWARNKPRALQRVFGRVPPWSVDGDLDDGDRGAYAELLMEAASLDSEHQSARREEAAEFFRRIVRPNPYQQQRYSELLLDLGRAEEAQDRLNGHPELSTNAFVKRLMARARLALDDPSDALVWIDQASANLRTERFRSSFLRLRYLIRRALHDPAAVDDLRRAVGAAAPGHELDLLVAELASVSD